jgi:hypothetical protein
MLTTPSVLRYLADLTQPGGTLTVLAAMVLGVLACWRPARRDRTGHRSGARDPRRRDPARRKNHPAPRGRPARPATRKRGGRS